MILIRHPCLDPPSTKEESVKMLITIIASIPLCLGILTLVLNPGDTDAGKSAIAWLVCAIAIKFVWG